MAGGRLHPPGRRGVEPDVAAGGGAPETFRRARGQDHRPDPEWRRQNPRHLPSGEGRYGWQLNGRVGGARLAKFSTPAEAHAALGPKRACRWDGRSYSGISHENISEKRKSQRIHAD